MRDAPKEVQKLFAGLWAGIQKSERDAEAAAAKINPVKHRLSRVIDGHLGYTYLDAGTNGRGSRVRFCCATNRNVAGYFLLWRETRMKKKTIRDQWDSTTSKRCALRWIKTMKDDFKAA